MPAKKGNTYAEKYDHETAKKFFEDSLELVKENDNLFYIGQVAVKMNTYRQLYDYLIDRFEDLDTIKKEIDGILESRVAERTFEGKGNSTYAIFHLKNNHGWKDKQEHDLTSKGEQVVFYIPDNDRD